MSDFDIGELVYPLTEEDIYFRERVEHGRESGDIHIEASLVDFLRVLLIHKECNKNGKLKVLWIENNPERIMPEIDKRWDNFESQLIDIEKLVKNESGESLSDKKICRILSYIFNSFGGEIYIYTRNFRKLRDKLIEAWKKGQDLSVKCKKLSDVCDKTTHTPTYSISLQNDIDFVLIDIFLGEGEVDGLEIVKLLREIAPHVPAFTFSIANDYQVTRKTILNGSDFHIHKTQVFSIPYAYYAYINIIGPLINYITTPELRRSLLGNIRYWNFKRNYLWYGDKCYHMIDHSFCHSQDNWINANKILVPLLRIGSVKGFFSKIGEQKEIDRLLYSFSMALWLHDIGHKGNNRYGEPHLIRETHGVISGELIISNPEFFGIKEVPIENIDVEKELDFYRDLTFPLGVDRKTLPQLILERVTKRKTKKLLITEMIALFSMYHKSNSPSTEREFYLNLRKGKYIPLDFYEGYSRERAPVYLEKILDILGNDGFKEVFLTLLALFRFVDGIDIKISRVGDPLEAKMRKAVIKHDCIYVQSRLEKTVKKMSMHISDPHMRSLFLINFYNNVLEKIDQNESIRINEMINQLKNFDEMEEYLALVNYLYFLKAQPGHISLHSSVEDIKIEHLGGKIFKISLMTSRSKEELEAEEVYEVGKVKETLYERLIGKNCYVIRELNNVKKYLSNLVDDKELEIELINRTTGDVLGRYPMR